MALTLVKISKPEHLGAKRVAVYDVTFDSSYPTGGLALAPSSVGLRTIDTVFNTLGKNAAGTSGLPVAYDYTNKKLQAYRYDGASAGKAFVEEVANAVDLSTFTVRLTIIGN